MYIDFAFIDTSINDNEAKDTIKYIVENNCVNSITVPYYFMKTIKPFINNGLDFSCLIDYPLGISDTKSRSALYAEAIKAGFNTLDICIPQNLIANRKYDKIREDIKLAVDTVGTTNINLRYILEYRKFDHHCLKKICEIFETMGVKYVFPSSGYFLDDISDNILACAFLYKNSKDLNIICTGNAWTNKHFENIKKIGLFGLRISSLYALKNFSQFNLSQQKE